MGLLQIALVLAAGVTPVIWSMPTGTDSASDPLVGFPKLSLGGVHGFLNVDMDGVYRAYHPDGTVVDAARLIGAQIDQFLAAITPQTTAVELAEMTEQYAKANSALVTDKELLSPPESVKPAEKIEMLAAVALTPRDVNPLSRRLGVCTVGGAYCIHNPDLCYVAFCDCNGVF